MAVAPAAIHVAPHPLLGAASELDHASSSASSSALSSSLGKRHAGAEALAAAEAAEFEAKRRRREAAVASAHGVHGSGLGVGGGMVGGGGGGSALWAELEERVRYRPELAPLLDDVRMRYVRVAACLFYVCEFTLIPHGLCGV